VFVNIGAMNRHIGSLEARIEELKREVGAIHISRGPEGW